MHKHSPNFGINFLAGQHVFVVYPFGQNGYLVFDIATGHIFTSQDVTFYEDQFLFQTSHSPSTTPIIPLLMPGHDSTISPDPLVHNMPEPPPSITSPPTGNPETESLDSSRHLSLDDIPANASSSETAIEENNQVSTQLVHDRVDLGKSPPAYAHMTTTYLLLLLMRLLAWVLV
uniref:Retroviral polymerase SH3-like domain-containing protein n=1 Tax=Nelumbo nucifera TaxID=4432 RepID=A0A822XLW4_NELNU|nr:TPA_asm: hypothetical protein HUJ06_021399 [Nelumbo nucifera]